MSLSPLPTPPSALGFLSLDSDPTAARAARTWVTDQLASWPPGSPVDDALMVVSELVTNSVQHGPGGTIDLALELKGDELTITVVDGGTPEAPLAAREASDSKESGRGLAIVEALSVRWGTSPTETGTTVWAVLPIPGDPRDLP